MGYPAYITPRDPMTAEEIDSLEQQSGKKISTKRRKELQAGHPGESHWHNLPDDLKAELEAYIAGYKIPEYGQTLDTFDGPCIWLDMETRMLSTTLCVLMFVVTSRLAVLSVSTGAARTRIRSSSNSKTNPTRERGARNSW